MGQQRFVGELDVLVVGVGQKALAAQGIDQSADLPIGAQSCDFDRPPRRHLVDHRRQFGKQSGTSELQLRFAVDQSFDAGSRRVDDAGQSTHAFIGRQGEALPGVALLEHPFEGQGDQRQRAFAGSGRREECRNQFGLHRNTTGLRRAGDDRLQLRLASDRFEGHQ